MWAQDDSGAAYSKGIDYQSAFDWTKSNWCDSNPLKDGVSRNGAMNWLEALAYLQTMNERNYFGYSDWRLPSVKELETITDYGYSPVKTAAFGLSYASYSFWGNICRA
jgi:hypothetical protein